MPPQMAFEVIQRIAASVDLPVTADLEAGYQLPAKELVHRLIEAGAVGCNLEDTDHHGSGTLVELERQVERIAQIRAVASATGLHIVLNARIDLFVHPAIGSPEKLLDEAIARARAYLAAGADCVYPILLADPSAIGRIVRETGAPVNVMLRPDGPNLQELTRLGVARVSLGGRLFRVALMAARQAAHALLSGDVTKTAEVPTGRADLAPVRDVQEWW